jgi:hypothetical protein
VPVVDVPLKEAKVIGIVTALTLELGGCAMPITEGAENGIDELAAVALSGEPARRKVDRNARAQHEHVCLEAAAHAVGVSLKLAAFHPDRLVRAEMLDFGYRILSGRAGPESGSTAPSA